MTKEEAINVLKEIIDESWIFSDIEKAPTIDACEMAISALSKNKCGEWKRTYLDHVAMGERPSILYCSACCQCIAYPTNYCPNCGADMRGKT